MNKVLLFGATGNIGKAIAKELNARGYDLTAVIRNQQKANEIAAISNKQIIADVTNADSLKEVCQGFDVVVSALGKSVSPNDKSKPSFTDIDLNANTNILNEALKSGAKKFAYISVFHAEKYPELVYFKSHFDFEQQLKSSGIDYTIVRPPAVFSSFLDLMSMAKKGRLMTLGKGDKKTNPIYEGDLAKIVVDSIQRSNIIIEAGGKEVLTRKEINGIIQRITAPNKKTRSVPIGLIKAGLPLIKIFDRNSYDKFAFFLAVMEGDVLAPEVGEMKLEDYVRVQLKNKVWKNAT